MRAKRRSRKLPIEAVTATIESLTHDGRGVAHIDGKAVFILGALTGEQVLFHYKDRKKSYDIGQTSEVLVASPDRVEPKCAHYGICGGCSLQHMSAQAQVQAKQQILLDQLMHIGKVAPDAVLPPITGESWGYRRKARLGVKYVIKKERVLVGFREKFSSYLAELTECEVLHPSVGMHLNELRDLISALTCYDKIPQIEVAIGDNATALIFRHLSSLAQSDLDKLAAFGKEHGLQIYLQSGGPDTVELLWPEPGSEAESESNEALLYYRVDNEGVEFHFLPTDFTQVNAAINRQMVDLALEQLDPQTQDSILDLFCGLGNFSLPLARRAGAVTGVEGDRHLINRARQNAEYNGITNVSYYNADLAGTINEYPWAKPGFDKILLDPPRTGAQAVIEQIIGLGKKKGGPEKVVYISCNPSTLARDAGELVHKYGYRLVKGGILDMFPHTAHVESVAVFEK